MHPTTTNLIFMVHILLLGGHVGAKEANRIRTRMKRRRKWWKTKSKSSTLEEKISKISIDDDDYTIIKDRITKEHKQQ